MWKQEVIKNDWICDIIPNFNRSIVALVKAFIGRSWVDAYDPEGDNEFIQTRTGLSLPYTNWHHGEPNSWNEKCVYIGLGDGTWNDFSCWRTVPFVCEDDIIWTGTSQNEFGVWNIVYLWIFYVRISCCINTDFGITLINNSIHNDTSDYLDDMYSNCFIPLINRPTWVTDYSTTLIDHIFTNTWKSRIYGSGYSGHWYHRQFFCIS